MRNKLIAVIVILSLISYGGYKGVKMAEGTSQSTNQTETTVQQVNREIETGTIIARADMPSNTTITGATLTDVPGLTTTFTIPENNQRRIKATLYCSRFQNIIGGAGTVAISIFEGNTPLASQVVFLNLAIYAIPINVTYSTVPTSGNHTYKATVYLADTTDSIRLFTTDTGEGTNFHHENYILIEYI